MEPIVGRDVQLSSILGACKPRDVLLDAKRFFKADYPGGNLKLVDKVFLIVKRLYDGRMPGYLACAVQYHDYAHSVSVFGAVSRLIDGCFIVGKGLDAALAVETLIAALIHDTGYIREEGDTSGTGAQYTKVHVTRSADFARREAVALGLGGESVERVARMILGTDIGVPWDKFSFESEGERTGTEILAAADLLGQMADRAYLEKLLFLYYEFREAGIGGYDSAFDILKKTAGFYESTKARLDGPLGAVSARSREHFAARYGVDKDLYREAIERQMVYLGQILKDDSTNFRKKLKRMDIEAIEKSRAATA
jgi:hypothetical protein